MTTALPSDVIDKLTKKSKGRLTESEKEQLDLVVRNIPQWLYVAMSGKSRAQLKEQAVVYGIPWGGATVDLHDVLAKIHELISRNAYLLNSGTNGTATEKKKEEEWKIATLKRKELEGSLVSVNALTDRFNRLANILAEFGKKQGNKYGPKAQAEFNECLESIRLELADD